MRLNVFYAASLLTSCYNHSIPIAPDQSSRFRTQFDTAMRSVSDGDYDTAARYLRTAIQIDPTHANALQILGR